MKQFDNDPIGQYNRVNKLLIDDHQLMPYTPQISDVERRQGEIVRYFIRFVTHTSSADIFEVDNRSYQIALNSRMYHGTSIIWKISGDLNDKYQLTSNGVVIRLSTGVITTNKLGTELANETLPGIMQYITDYKKFWK